MIEIPDFGYTSPKKTKKQCTNPEFKDKYFHRIAVMKKKLYTDGLMPGWTILGICCGCGRKFKLSGFHVK